MKIIRLRNNTDDKSNGPPGVTTAGIIGGFPFFASMTASYLQAKSSFAALEKQQNKTLFIVTSTWLKFKSEIEGNKLITLSSLLLSTFEE